MTKDELAEEFYKAMKDQWRDWWSYTNHFHGVWNKVVAPYLAIPRSLKDDPPTQEGLYVFLGEGRYEFHTLAFGKYPPCDTTWATHWVKIPQSHTDKDEQQFEEWYARAYSCSRDTVHKAHTKVGWMAARGK